MTSLRSTLSPSAARFAICAALASVLAISGLWAGVQTAHAEGCGDTAAAGDKKQGKFHTEIVNGKKIIVIDTEVSVCGKVPRPSVVYVLTAKNINYEWETLKQDFMPLILDSVKKAPL
jgi:hypothetical protein